MKPTIGRIVHYVLADGGHRAATVTNTSGGDHANLTVHLDGMNDLQRERSSTAALGSDVRPGFCRDELVPTGAAANVPGILSVGSAAQDDDHAPGSWHWPERE